MLQPKALTQVRNLSLSLPEATVRIRDDSRQFSEVRGRWFCIVSASKRPDDPHGALMIVAVDPGEREMLIATGHPFFDGGLNPNRIGVYLDDETDWEEIRELLIDSFRIIAPKHLSAQLPDPTPPG